MRGWAGRTRIPTLDHMVTEMDRCGARERGRRFVRKSSTDARLRLDGGVAMGLAAEYFDRPGSRTPAAA
ncbi:hypothetical protein GCM10010116_06820 [Microbispora rosea subsp. aerata]|nr:hypothetical protein GCM10010116_06820 [Microbispora rosea subsp. aerata]GIH54815.1 hypothetical protein Mro02_17290 [Microbispora rosea subsp. aerata]GLJ83711.1 hypothetical protein GCM10017588_24390 [Microbispora rosea subsp. aerata]